MRKVLFLFVLLLGSASALAAQNARTLVEAGAEVLVAGSAVFGRATPEADARRLIEAAS